MPEITKNNNAALLTTLGIETSDVGLDDGSVLASLRVVRYVPGRRCVCHAIWHGRGVYAKLFFGHNAERNALRDVAGVNHLQNATILTPEILKQSEIKPLGVYVVIFEEIVSSENAEAVWVHSSESARLTLAKQLTQTVSAHHEAGLLQTDLHLKNFLVKKEKIYSIDGDGIRKFGMLANKQALDNLSRLLSKFDVLMLEKHLSELLACYAEARQWAAPPKVEAIKANIDAARYKATVSYADKKVFRQCTDVNIYKKKNIFIATSSTHPTVDLPQVDAQFDGYFTPENIIKNGNTCTVALVTINGVRIAIKRYNIKNFWHGISRALRQTRAAVSWANAHRLKLLALETAHPIALIEIREFGLKGKAYFLAETIDAPDMVTFFKQSSDKVLRARAVKELVQLFYRLHLLNISHGDMKATNIKVLADGSPALIDLDSMRQHRIDFLAQRAHVRDIKRFMRNWKDDSSLYNAFLKGFKVIYADHAALKAAQILE